MPVSSAKYEEVYGAYLEMGKEADKLKREVKILREENGRLKEKVNAFLEETNKEKGIRESLKRIEAENEKLRKNNDHLYELHVNRSNADRNIKPKKEHSGYIAKWQGESYDRRLGNCVKITIETPYSTELPYKDVKKKIEAFLLNFYKTFERNVKLSCNYTTGYWMCDVWSRKFIDISLLKKVLEGKPEEE